MVHQTYTYNVSVTLNDKVSPAALHSQIIPLTIGDVGVPATLDKALVGVVVQGDDILIEFAGTLSNTVPLDGVVAAHDGEPLQKGAPVYAPTFAELPGQTHWRGNGNSPYVCTAGAVTTHDFLIPTDVKLYEGTYYVSDDAVLGDYVDFRVIDKDDVMGQGGTPASPYVVTEYIDNLGVVGGERRTMRSGKGTLFPAGLYLRTVYHSTGVQNVQMLVDFLFFDQD